jgi:cell division protein FtsB
MQQVTEREAAQRAAAQGRVEGLDFQRSELKSQLKDLNRRRNELDEQRHVASSPAARSGLEARIAEIDARTARIDQQILSLDDQIATATAEYGAIRAGRPEVVVQPGQIRIPEIPMPPMNFGRSRGIAGRDVAVFMGLEAVLLGAMGVLFWRMGLKRMREQFERMFVSQSQQLNQLQQAVDVIGIEVERISEGQRYVAKVLSDGSPASALSASRRESV